MKKTLTVLAVIIFSALSAHAEQVESLWYLRETREVKKWLENTEVVDLKHYCIKGSMSCRSMYKLKDKTTGKPAPFYYDTFFSSARQVGSTCYMVPTKDQGKFALYMDMKFDGVTKITWKSDLKAQVDLDPSTGYYKFMNMKFLKLGTSQYLLGTMTQTDDRVLLEGTEYDENDPNYKVPVKVEYLRVNP